MLTVGLCKELLFISVVLKRPIETLFNDPVDELRVRIENKYIKVWYRDTLIWTELMDGPTSNFGIESCDNISRIVNCIEQGTDWQKYKFIDKTAKQ